MNFSSDFDLTKLFLNKTVTIFCDEQKIQINLPTLKDFLNNEKWEKGFYFLKLNIEQWNQLLPLNLSSSFDYLTMIVFKLGFLKQYSTLSDSICNAWDFLFNNLNINFEKQSLIADDVIITSEIWNYIVYILKLSCGEKVTEPRVFKTPAEKEFYLQQLKNEEKIQKIRQKDKPEKDNKDSLIKSLLAITYSFPSLTFDYLFDQTLAQIHWLQKMAAGEVSYRVNAQILAAGNMKKGSKLKFFIE